MTKTGLFILVIGMGLACGSPLEEGESVVHVLPPDVPSPDAVEIDGDLFYEDEPIVEYLDAAQAEYELFDDEPIVDKATYVIPNGYGIAGGGVGCASSGFAGGECKVPKSKSGCVMRIADTDPPLAGQDASIRQAFPKWKSIVTPLGWMAQHDDVACALAARKIRVKFLNMGPGILGLMTPLVATGDSFTIPAGTVKPWTHADIKIGPEVLGQLVIGKTPAQSSNAERNVMLHELIHSAGTAHNVIIDTLMAASPVQPPAVSSYYSANLTPLAAENTRIQNYSVTP